jgi:hypothetical protein
MAIELVTSMPLEECARRLREGLASGRVRGRFDGTELIIAKTISYRNSFQTRLVAELVEENGQTRIRCNFSMHPFVIVFITMWLLILFLAGGGAAFVTIVGFLTGSPSEDTWPGGLFPGMIMIFGLGLVAVGRILARDEKEFLIAFVSDTIEGEQSSSAA